jgi:hypothetical protein
LFGLLAGSAVAWGEWQTFFDYMVRIANSSGAYGTGERGFATLAVIKASGARMLTDYGPHFVLFGALLAVMILTQRSDGRRLAPMQRFLLGAVLAIAAKFVLTLKQYADHYVIEATAILPFLAVVAAGRLIQIYSVEPPRWPVAGAVVAGLTLLLLPPSLARFNEAKSAARQNVDEQFVAEAVLKGAGDCRLLPSYAYGAFGGSLSFGYTFTVRQPAQIAAYEKRYRELGLTPPAHYDYFEDKVFSLGRYIDFDKHVPPGACAAIMVTGYEINANHKALKARQPVHCRHGRINVYAIGRTCEALGLPKAS